MQLLQDWAIAHAQARPDATALVCGASRLSYGELDALSNQLARVLREAGCRQGEPVAMLMPKSTLAIAAMLGVCKADAVLVPLDPGSPSARLRKMLKVCGIQRMLAAGPVEQSLQELVEEVPPDDLATRPIEIGWLDPEKPRGLPIAFALDDLSVYASDPVQTRNRSFHPSHVLFTSGSSGIPKGVMLTHANVIHSVEWAVRHFGIGETDRVSCHSPLHVDMSLLDVFAAAAAGAELHLVPPIVSVLPSNLSEFIRSSGITHWYSVPSVLSYMAQFDLVKSGSFPSLTRVVWSGDVMPAATLRYLMKRLEHASFTQLYGHPETAAVSSVHTVRECPSDSEQSIPIGRACGGMELFVLDSSLEPTARGEVGDLYVSGANVSRGYWGDLAQTNVSFIRNPERLNDRLYRTGDLARIDAHGLIHLEGRRDLQIKTRGHRVELGEIETALSAIGTLKQSAIVALNRGGLDGALICCAYVPAGKEACPPVGLRRELSRHVPSYMLPVHWMASDALPVNGDGTIDRLRLKGLFEARLDAQEHRPVA